MTALQADLTQLSQSHSEQTAYVAVSPSELRQLFGQVESEFYRSKLYKKICDWFQRQLPGEDDLVSQLTGSLGKEAIRLTLRQLVSNGSHAPAAKAAASAPTALGTTTNPTEESKANPAKANPVTVKPPVPLATVPQADAALSSPAAPSPQSDSNGDCSAAKPVANGAIDLDHPNPFALVSENVAIAPKSSGEEHHTAESGIELDPIQQNQAATLTDVGIILQQVRQQAGLSLEELHHMTHVPKHHIQAIEAGRSDRLPEEVYVRGFVRHLSLALGLDSTQLTGYNSTAACRSPLNLEPKGQASSRHRRSQVYSAAKSSSAHLRPAHLYTGYATLMLGAIGSLCWVAWHQPVDDGATPPLPPDTSAEEDNRSVWAPASMAEGVAAKLRYFQLSKQQARQLGEIESIALPELILNQLQTTQALDSQSTQ